MDFIDEDHMRSIGIKVGQMLPKRTAYLIVAVEGNELGKTQPFFACCSNIPLSESRRIARVYLQTTASESQEN